MMSDGVLVVNDGVLVHRNSGGTHGWGMAFGRPLHESDGKQAMHWPLWKVSCGCAPKPPGPCDGTLRFADGEGNKRKWLWVNINRQ